MKTAKKTSKVITLLTFCKKEANLWNFITVYRGGESPRSKSYMWAEPKVSVFKNGQFRDPFFLRKICFFWKKQKLLFALLKTITLFWFLKRYFPNLFLIVFFMDTFFVFRTPFFEGLFWKNKFSFKGRKICFFFQKNP